MMPTTTPQAMLNELIDRFNAGDIDGVLTHYEPDAISIDKSGNTSTGEENLRNAFEAFFAMKAQLTLVNVKTIVTGDIGCNYSKWEITGQHSDGKILRIKGSAIDVVRRQMNGSWKIVIDNPWGTAIVD